MTDFVCFYLIKLPTHIKGVTTPNNDGTFSVYINSAISVEEQRKTMTHELEHIRADHFNAPLSVRFCEIAAINGNGPDSRDVVSLTG